MLKEIEKPMGAFSADADHPTEQTFHVTGLDPRSALCGKSGRIWAAPDWPPDDDMRTGLFKRCKVCDRLLTPALNTALEDARDLERAALGAYRNGWREGCGLAATPGEPARTVADHLVQECRELGRRVGAEAAGLVRDARSAEKQPPSATLRTDQPGSTDTHLTDGDKTMNDITEHDHTDHGNAGNLPHGTKKGDRRPTRARAR